LSIPAPTTICRAEAKDTDLSLKPEKGVPAPKSGTAAKRPEPPHPKNNRTPRFLSAHADVSKASTQSPQRQAGDTSFGKRTGFGSRNDAAKAAFGLHSFSRTATPQPLMTRAAWRKILEASTATLAECRYLHASSRDLRVGPPPAYPRSTSRPS
jgi:hypothetical protein